MFIRFESLVRDDFSRVNEGIFCAAYDCIWAVPRPQWCWARVELRRELNWFNDRLDAPETLTYRPGRRRSRGGICWFRDHATDHVNRARYMAWLLRELGYPVHIRRSDRPGAILWQDAHQVVALPDLRAPSLRADLVH